MELTRRLLGYVAFSVCGKKPEELLTLAAKNGYGVWGAHKKDGILYLKTGASTYRRLWKLAREKHLRLRIQKKAGIPFRWIRAKKRPGLLVGAVFFILVYVLLSQYVWEIDVTGNQRLKTSEILAAAEKSGLYIGALRSGLDAPGLGDRLMLELPEIGWVSVNTMGCFCEISLTETEKKPDISEQKEPVNLIAKRAGQIVRMEVFDGEAQVKVGDAVYEGQLLISGVMEDNTGKNYLRHASGVVTARTQRILTVSTDEVREMTVPTGEIRYRCSTRIFGLEIPLTFCKAPQGAEWIRERFERPFCIGNAQLPLSVFTESFTRVEKKEKKLSEEEARAVCEKLLAEAESVELKEAKILQKKISFSFKNGKYYLECAYICEENIALTSKILIN